jgi:hypothetical protein
MDTKEFGSAVKEHMQRPPCLLATKGSLGFTAEFPCDEGTSLFRGTCREPHPRCGNGLLLIQSFRAGNFSEEEGIRFALSLNASELTKIRPGMGSAAIATMTDAFTSRLFCPMQLTDQDCFPVFTAQPRFVPWKWRIFSRKLTRRVEVPDFTSYSGQQQN